MRLYFVVITLALITLSAALAPIQWDSPFYLFSSIDRFSPVIPHGRFVVLAAELPAMLLSRVTDNLYLLQFVYSLVYALLTLLPLLVSWWLVRSTAPRLYVWLAFAVNLVMLPAIFRLYSESLLALEFIWPVFLATLVPLNRRQLVVVSLFGMVLLITHPYAAPLLVMAALSAWVGLRIARPSTRSRRALALLLVVLAALAVARVAFFRTEYEAERTSLGSVVSAIQGHPIPLLSVPFALVAGLLVLAAARRTNAPRVWRVLPMLCVIVAGGLLLAYVSDGRLWQGASYKFVLPFVSAPFFLFAFLDRYGTPLAPQMGRLNRGVIQTLAVVFACVLGVQTAVWLRMHQDFVQSIEESPTACIPINTITGARGTMLDYFSTPIHAVLAQGRMPQKIVLRRGGCDEDFTEGIRLYIESRRAWNSDGWFDFSALERNLLGEQSADG